MRQPRSPSRPAPADRSVATTLWRVRAVLADRPGALAGLAQACGERGVNILALEVLPGVGAVTDELVLAAPRDWQAGEVVELLEDAGARPVLVGLAPASALADQVVSHVRAVTRLLDRPLAVAAVLAELLDAEVETPTSRLAGAHGLKLSVGGETMSLVREAPFTPTEQARADAVVDLAERLADSVTPPEPPPAPESRTPELRTHADAVIAEVADRKVGESRLLPRGSGWGVRVYVHPAWRRRGLGQRLLRGVTEMAVERGIGELDVRLDAQDLAGLRLVLASGLCGSISCDGGETRTRLVLARGRVPAGVPAQG